MFTWHDDTIKLLQLIRDEIIISLKFIFLNKLSLVEIFDRWGGLSGVEGRWVEFAVERAADDIRWTFKRLANWIIFLSLTHLWRSNSLDAINLQINVLVEFCGQYRGLYFLSVVDR